MKLPISDYVPTTTPGHLELDAFLFAPIYDEPNGMTLTVLSALARRGIDPWSEAARLADLPRAQAAEILAGLIASLRAAASVDAAAIAAQLVKLLPDEAAPVRTPARRAAETFSIWRQWPAVTPAHVAVVVVLAVALAFLIMQWTASAA